MCSSDLEQGTFHGRAAGEDYQDTGGIVHGIGGGSESERILSVSGGSGLGLSVN